VLRKDLQVFFKIILPLAVPAIIAGSTFVFMISLMDYSVPSIFQVNLYSLDIFANFSSDYNIAHALFLAIPLLIIAIVAASVFQSAFRSIALSSGSTKQCTKSLSFPVWFRILQWISFTIVFLQIAIPVISLIFAAGSPTAIIQSFTGSMREMGYTILISFVAALFSVPFSICAAAQINKSGYMKNIWWFMLVIPLTMPPPLIGIGLISLWNSFPGIYGTLIMPVIAGFIRFIPFATIITLAQMKRIDPQLIQAASILQKNPFQTLLKVRLPLLSRGILAAMCVMFILTSGELGATLLVAPPGKGTLTMKIYNYLHYGQSGTVAGLCLLMLVFSLIIGVLLYKLFIRRR
jgi:iron(III) transport system permease protein